MGKRPGTSYEELLKKANQASLEHELAGAMYALNRALSYFPDPSIRAIKRTKLTNCRDIIAEMRMEFDRSTSRPFIPKPGSRFGWKPEVSADTGSTRVGAPTGL